MAIAWGQFQNQNGSVRLDIRQLENVEKQLGKRYFTKVGIMGAKATNRLALGGIRKGGGHKTSKSTPTDMTNAEIGAIHEFGSITRKIPQRSFLRMPIWMKLPENLKLLGPAMLSGLTTGNIVKAYKKLGILGENIVQNAFESGGFGNWPKLSQRTIDRKRSSAILIDTAQLRKSITSQVVEGQ